VKDFQSNPGSQYANLFMTSEKVNGKSNLNHLNYKGSHLIIPCRIADRIVIQHLICLRCPFLSRKWCSHYANFLWHQMTQTLQYHGAINWEISNIDKTVHNFLTAGDFFIYKSFMRHKRRRIRLLLHGTLQKNCFVRMKYIDGTWDRYM
jgi:hypothetical protein